MIAFLRDHEIAHRDIKATNILIDPQTLRITLIDFGLSLKLEPSCCDNEQEEEYYCDFRGTPLYMGPEVLSRLPHRPVRCDIWSAAVLIWELLLGHHPFAEHNSIEDLLHKLEGGLAGDLKLLPPRSRKILSKLLILNEIKRPDPLEALSLFDAYSLRLNSTFPPPRWAESSRLRRSKSASSSPSHLNYAQIDHDNHWFE